MRRRLLFGDKVDPNCLIMYTTTDMQNGGGVEEFEPLNLKPLRNGDGQVNKLISNIYDPKQGCFVARYKNPITAIDTTDKSGDTGFFGNQTRLKTVKFPITVELISDRTFKNCSSLTEIVDFSELTNLKECKDWWIEGCSSIEEIVYPDSVDTLGTGQFRLCASLKKIIFPANLTTWTYESRYETENCNAIEEISFEKCKNLTFIPNGICSGKQNLRKLNGSETIFRFDCCPNLQRIGDSAFERCSNLSGDISFEGCTNLQTIGRNAFHESYSLKNIIFTGCSSLTNIDNGAFDNTCNRLGDGETGQIIGLEDCVNLVRIGQSAFAWTGQLTGDIDFSTLPKLEEIEHRAFIETGLNSITFDGCNSLKNIGSDAFMNCTGSISFGECENLQRIDTNAFQNCIGITGKLDLTGCPNLTLIDSRAFESCSNISEIDLTNCTKLELIGHGTFRDCSNLTYVNLTNCTSLSLIKLACFQRCGLLNHINFTNCNNLSYIEGNAFWMGLPIETIDIAPLSTWVNIQYENTWSVPMISTIIHFYLNGELLEHIVIPKECTTIGRWAFLNGIDIKTVEFHEDIEDIGEAAFNACRNLQNVINFNEVLSKLTEFKPEIFRNCNSLSNEIDFTLCENLVSIGDYAFVGCSNLKGNLDFSKCAKLETIGYMAFQECTSIEGPIDFSGCEQLKSIGERSFYGCAGITGSLDFSHNPNLTEIKQQAFNGCTGIETVDLSKAFNLTILGDTSFKWCKFGGSCDLRNTNLTNVGIYVFELTDLTEVRFPSTLETLGQGVFKDLKLTLLETPIMPADNSYWNGSEVKTLILNGDTVLDNLRTFFPTPNQDLAIYVKPELLSQYQEIYNEWNGRFHEISEYVEVE